MNVSDSGKRLLAGAMVVTIGLGTALCFRKPAAEKSAAKIPWSAGFTAVEPVVPARELTTGDLELPRLAGRIESLVSPPHSPTAPQIPSTATTVGQANAELSIPATTLFQRPEFQTPTATPAATTEQSISALNATKLPAIDEPKLSALRLSEPSSQHALPNNTAKANCESIYSLPDKLIGTDRPNSIDRIAMAPLKSSPHVEDPSLKPLSISSTYQTPTADKQALPTTPNIPTPIAALPGQRPSDQPGRLLLDTNYRDTIAPAATAPSAVTTLPTRHKVTDGDTLEILSRKYYGDSAAATNIFQANRQWLHQPDLLPIGFSLIIPALTGAPATTHTPGAPTLSTSWPTTAPQVGNGWLTPPATEAFTPRPLLVPPNNWSPIQPPSATIPTQGGNASGPITNPIGGAAAAFGPNGFTTPAGNGESLSASTTQATLPGWPPQVLSNIQQDNNTSWPRRVLNDTGNGLSWLGETFLGTGMVQNDAGKRFYLVRPLENWDTLGQRYYGAGGAEKLRSANPLLAGQSLRPGAVIALP